MKKFIIILAFVFLMINPAEVNATIEVEREGQITSDELQSNPAPSAPSSQPVIVTDEKNVSVPAQTTPSSPVSGKKKSTAATKQETKQDTSEEETSAEQEKISENTVPVSISENIVEEEIISENEVTIPAEEEVISENKVEKEEEPAEPAIENKSDKTKSFSGLRKAAGFLLLVIAVGLLVFFLYGHVQIFCLGHDDKYHYVGQCRISKTKGDIRIYISKFVLDRGKTSGYKITLSDFLLKSKGKIILILPGQSQIEVGRTRKEIQFNYD